MDDFDHEEFWLERAEVLFEYGHRGRELWLCLFRAYSGITLINDRV